MSAHIEPITHRTDGVWGWARERSGNKKRGGKCLIHRCAMVLRSMNLLPKVGANSYATCWQCPECAVIRGQQVGTQDPQQ